MNGTVTENKTVHLGILATVDNLVLCYGTDHHTRVTVRVVLIVSTNVIVNVDLCADVTVLKADARISRIFRRALSTSGIVGTYDTAASNVPRAPKSRYLVGVVYGDILEGNLLVGNTLVVPANYANYTTVTDVVNAGVRVNDCNILEGSAVICICRYTTGGRVLTVGGEVADSKILDSTAVYSAEEAHTVTVVVGSAGITAVVVTKHFPGILIEICNEVSVTVEGTLKRSVAAGNSCAVRTYVTGLLFIFAGVVVIADRIEDNTILGSVAVVCIDVADMDRCKKRYSLAAEAIPDYFIRVGVLILILCNLGYAGYLVHTAYDSAECCKLVCVSDIKFSLICIIPTVVELTLPDRRLSNKCYLGEGCHVESHVTGSGIVSERVVRRLAVLTNGGHNDSLAVLYVVETEVGYVKTNGKELVNGDCDRCGVIRRYAIDVYVQRLGLLVICENNICATFGNYVNVKNCLSKAGIELSTLREKSADVAVFIGHIGVLGN